MEVSDKIIIYSKKALIAELAGTVLKAMHQDRFNELHDLIEATVEDLEQ